MIDPVFYHFDVYRAGRSQLFGFAFIFGLLKFLIKQRLWL